MILCRASANYAISYIYMAYFYTIPGHLRLAVCESVGTSHAHPGPSNPRVDLLADYTQTSTVFKTCIISLK